ncbi:glycosyltransferase family 2 protein [Luteolibacter yonseiensis]|uniref:Glycosyltransferase family 2 protein n=1 Tax=Luteolibacter yonseiensis TaxID=1144680 RepID=A0A934R1V6_9BACT|nr:glycosyltransferase family 2 protein [Luteolibacter yonseiensis]MBK1815279.1 glycosyltransferase family 2 protein [Luteolibacter yonseiensis]
MNAFTSATVILPVLNETYSMRETVRIIEATCAEDVGQYIIMVCERTKPESLAICREIAGELGERASVNFQTLPFVGGAFRDAFDLVQGSHVVMMSSDLETDPALVRTMIHEAKLHPDSVTTASRWIKGGHFVGYNPVKLLANKVFQMMFSLLYGTTLTDLTYAYRIFPTSLVRRIRWVELKHPFFLETALKPLRLGVPIREIPAVWKARTEGESVNPFMANFIYFKIALRTRFCDESHIVRASAIMEAVPSSGG